MSWLTTGSIVNTQSIRPRPSPRATPGSSTFLNRNVFSSIQSVIGGSAGAADLAAVTRKHSAPPHWAFSKRLAFLALFEKGNLTSKGNRNPGTKDATLVLHLCRTVAQVPPSPTLRAELA